jgi:mannan endo-1,4-beta-mannosidase
MYSPPSDLQAIMTDTFPL